MLFFYKFCDHSSHLTPRLQLIMTNVRFAKSHKDREDPLCEQLTPCTRDASVASRVARELGLFSGLSKNDISWENNNNNNKPTGRDKRN